MCCMTILATFLICAKLKTNLRCDHFFESYQANKKAADRQEDVLFYENFFEYFQTRVLINFLDRQGIIRININS